MTSRKALFYSGILGLLGAAAMLAGDLLLYAHWGDMPEVKEAVHALVPARKSVLLATSTDLHISGLLGPVASILYLFGAWHLYLNL